MGRKCYILLLVLAVLFLGTQVFAGKPVETKVLSLTKESALIKTGSLYHKLGVHEFKGNSKTVVDTLYYYEPPDAPERYDDFLGSYQGTGSDPADTCVHWFTLLAPGKITKFFMQNVTAGQATCYLFNPATYYDPGEDGWYYMWPDDPAIRQVLPFGVPLNCAAQVAANQFTGDVWTPTWNTLDLVSTFGDGINIDGVNDSLDFWFGYALDGTGNPQIWQDGFYHDSDEEGSSRSFSSLHAVGGYGAWYRIVNTSDNTLSVVHMMQLEVQYDALPPVISNVANFSDTFEETKTITAKIIDLEGDNFTAELRYKIGINGTWSGLPMSLVEGNTYSADMALSQGDTVYYYVKATDVGSLTNGSSVVSYARLVPPVGKSILLVNDGGRDNDAYYTDALDNLSADYYLWRMADHNGIDKSIVNYEGFSTIIVFGWGTTIVPITNVSTQDECDLKGFLDNGGNLMLVDMDWLFSWSLPATGSLVAGDFAYDYFGLASYENDPDDDGNSSNGGSADIEMKGVSDDVVSGEFTAPSYFGPIDYELPDPVWANWGDYVTPGNDAMVFMKGKNSDKGMAIRKTGSNYRTMLYTFPIELNSQASQFQTLLEKSLLWLTRQTSVDETPVVALKYMLAQNYPNPFNPSTRIEYGLPEATELRISIYDLLGNKVVELVNARQAAGHYTVEWNGRDTHGAEVATGIYFYELRSEQFMAKRKMFFIK
jgi:hypothetical protein